MSGPQYSRPSRDGPTGSLVSRIASLRWADLPHDVQHAARRHLLDTVGVMVAGCAGDVAGQLCDLLARERAPGTVRCPAVAGGWTGWTRPMWAAPVPMALKLDDGYRQGSVHPGVAVVPALLAQAHGRGVSGARLLEALVAG